MLISYGKEEEWNIKSLNETSKAALECPPYANKAGQNILSDKRLLHIPINDDYLN